MSDYYVGLIACPECGDIRQGNNRETCQLCRGAGHLYRMQSLDDLQARVLRLEADGYHRAAIKAALIRDALAAGMGKVAP